MKRTPLQRKTQLKAKPSPLKQSTLKRSPRKKRAKLSDSTITRMLARTKGQCAKCGGKGDHPHHVLPVEHFPQFTDSHENLVWLCEQDHWDHHYKPGGRLRWLVLPPEVRGFVLSMAYADGQVYLSLIHI